MDGLSSEGLLAQKAAGNYLSKRNQLVKLVSGSPLIPSITPSWLIILSLAPTFQPLENRLQKFHFLPLFISFISFLFQRVSYWSRQPEIWISKLDFLNGLSPQGRAISPIIYIWYKDFANMTCHWSNQIEPSVQRFASAQKLFANLQVPFLTLTQTHGWCRMMYILYMCIYLPLYLKEKQWITG